MRNKIFKFFWYLFFGGPIDYAKIGRELRLDKDKFAKKYPPIHEQIDAHFGKTRQT